MLESKRQPGVKWKLIIHSVPFQRLHYVEGQAGIPENVEFGRGII